MYVTHDQIEAMTLATRVAVMKDGVVQHLDEPQAVYDRPANVYVARFVGSPAMNIIPGVLEVEGSAINAVVDVANRPAARISGISLSGEAARKYAGKKVLVGIRPENFSIANGDARAALTVDVDVVEPTGPDTLVVFQLGGVEVTARLPPKQANAGRQAVLLVDTSKVVIFDADTEARID